jgi:hypothetical protein
MDRIEIVTRELFQIRKTMGRIIGNRSNLSALHNPGFPIKASMTLTVPFHPLKTHTSPKEGIRV